VGGHFQGVPKGTPLFARVYDLEHVVAIESFWTGESKTDAFTRCVSLYKVANWSMPSNRAHTSENTGAAARDKNAEIMRIASEFLILFIQIRL